MSDDALTLGETHQPLVRANILHFNSLGSNGISLNGISLNGISLNGISLNGIALNGIALNGVSANGISLNGISLNGISLNGVALNGIALNGIALNGIALNGIALNGIALNGIALKGSQVEDFKILLSYMAECSLQAGQCITINDIDGTKLTYCGVEGIDTGWASGLPDLGKSDLVGTCVLDRATADGHEVIHTLVQLAAFKSVFGYLVECALAEEQSVTIYDENNAPRLYEGALGLAPEWETGPLGSQGEMLVSACLAARGNALHRSVQISLRGAGLPTTGVERALYNTHEGAFWANLFTPDPYINACLVRGGGISGRVCTETGTCGFNITGSCADVCASQDSVDGAYSSCVGDSAVINTFLSLGMQTGFGPSHSCGRKSDGTVWCWGRNNHGQLGLGTTSNKELVPQEVDTLDTTIAEVVSGKGHSCARSAGGTMWCWGKNDEGQLGDGSTTNQSTPHPVAALGSDVASIGIGKHHTCSHKTDGSLWCWGDNDHGQLGDGSTTSRSQPVQVSALGTEIANVSTGTNAHTTCAVTNTGDLWCWGKNNHGQLGDGSNRERHTPVLVSEDESGSPFGEATDTCTGATHSCARKVDGTVWCWGQDNHRQIGGGFRKRSKRRPVMVNLPVEAAPRGLSCGRNHTCALGVDGSLWCWGDNHDGALGNGTYARQCLPVKVIGLSGTISRVTAADRHTCVILDDDSVWCWGRDSQDVLFPAPRSNVPIQVISSQQWRTTSD